MVMELCPMFGMIVVVRPMFSRMRVAVSFRLVLMVVRVLVLVQMLVVVYVAVFMTVRHVRVDMVVVSVLMTVGMFMVSFQGRTSSTEFSLHHIIMPVTFRVKQATEDIVLSRTLSAGRHTLDEPFDHTVGASRPAKVILK